MKLGSVVISFLLRLLIALPAFVVIVCAAACAGVMEMLSTQPLSRPVRIDVINSSSDRG